MNGRPSPSWPVPGMMGREPEEVTDDGHAEMGHNAAAAEPAPAGAAGHRRGAGRHRLERRPARRDGAAGLGDGGLFPGLEELSLSVAGLGNEGARALARAVRLTRLYRLELNHNGIGESGVRALADAPHLSGLETFFLEGNSINTTGVLRERKEIFRSEEVSRGDCATLECSS